MAEQEEKGMKIGSKVFIVISGNVVATAEIEAIDGEPEGSTCHFEPCELGTVIAQNIKPFEECMSVQIPDRSSSPQFLSEIVNSRWLFDKNCVIPFISEDDNCGPKNGKRRLCGDDEESLAKKKNNTEPMNKRCPLGASMKRWICTQSILNPSQTQTDLAIAASKKFEKEINGKEIDRSTISKILKEKSKWLSPISNQRPDVKKKQTFCSSRS
jgi:hypothetical protein